MDKGLLFAETDSAASDIGDTSSIHNHNQLKQNLDLSRASKSKPKGQEETGPFSSQVYEWTKIMSNIACSSALPSGFKGAAPSDSKPPRSRSVVKNSDEDVLHLNKYYHKPSSGSNDEMDVHTLATASTAAATTSYSMTDDASEASEVGMEVIMSSKHSGLEHHVSSTYKQAQYATHTFKAGKETFTLDERYSFIRTIGSGAYGVVISANDTAKKRNVAIKLVPRAFNDEVDAKRILREIKLLKHFRHENIISILDMMSPQGAYVDDFNDVYIVCDLMETDLHRIIYSKQALSIDHVQYFIYQILRGLKYIHSAQVIHRDLKPSNLLVNSNCDLKICDFGLARGINSDYSGQRRGSMLLTEYVVTRWYRAPEIMLACHEYSKPVDVWSVGCIFAELMLRKPIFPGDDYIDQLSIISEKLGKLSEKDLDFVTSEKAKRFMRRLPNKAPLSLSRQFPGVSRLALDVLHNTLQIHPKRRITVEEALAHSFFTQLHNPEDEPVAHSPFDFGFENQSLSRLRLKELIWSEAGEFRPSSLPVPPRRSMLVDLHEA